MNQYIKILLNEIKLNPIRSFIYFAILVIAIINISLYYMDKGSVFEDYSITKGWILKYDEYGIGPNIYVTYEYEVGNVKYQREINSPNKTFHECKNDITRCNNKRFIVIYSNKDPTKSLIDFTNEIDVNEKIIKPKALNNFQ